VKIKKNIVMLTILFSTISFIYIIYVKWIKETERHALEKYFKSSFENIKICKDIKLKLTDIVPNKYSEVCFQSAYMSKLDFENSTGKAVSDFEVLEYDGEIIWWFFEKNGNGINIKPPTITSIEPKNPEMGKCYSTRSSIFSFSCRLNKPTFKLEEK
jgi:hypothetical protein